VGFFFGFGVWIEEVWKVDEEIVSRGVACWYQRVSTVKCQGFHQN